LSVVKELYNMTECCICIEVFTDLRVLPCQHTFCLNCLMNYGKDKQPGDNMPCPLCRKEFTIPADGLSAIQKNFFVEKRISDITECCICIEVFTDPRVLPCQHTFCLQCLLNYGKDKQPGDNMPCPLCRKEFTIPADGLSGIQKNFFMEKRISDMTECCICIEVFTDPRVLPCQHTFCLNCLMNYGKNKQPGDDMPCPLCRKEFTIPAVGLLGIKKNLFMENLISARKLSAGEEAGHKTYSYR